MVIYLFKWKKNEKLYNLKCNYEYFKEYWKKKITKVKLKLLLTFHIFTSENYSYFWNIIIIKYNIPEIHMLGFLGFQSFLKYLYVYEL